MEGKSFIAGKFCISCRNQGVFFPYIVNVVYGITPSFREKGTYNFAVKHTACQILQGVFQDFSFQRIMSSQSAVTAGEKKEFFPRFPGYGTEIFCNFPVYRNSFLSRKAP